MKYYLVILLCILSFKLEAQVDSIDICKSSYEAVYWQGATFFYSNQRAAPEGDDNFNNPINWSNNKVPNGCSDLIIPEYSLVRLHSGDVGKCRTIETEDNVIFEVEPGASLNVISWIVN